ncbi:MAG: gluconate 2-dehydrogenase subunit 3 family protein, partial [Actinomycetota bacterium]|nr:gluconate 2-dehydrogenase subunit 3 family protein [Actinomycetota bacterium]
MSEQRSGERLFFDEHQWATAEAAMARILPTDDSPGAREAGTVGFVDRYLSGIEYVYAKPDGSGFEELTGRRAGAWRRRINVLREKYVEGIEEMDRRSRERFGDDFARLTEEQQDEILTIMERPEQEADLQNAQVVVGYGAPVEPAIQRTSAEMEID